MTQKLTLNKINAELKKLGHKAELCKGRGYFYFTGKDAEGFYESGVYVSQLNSLSLKQWIEEFNNKKKEVR